MRLFTLLVVTCVTGLLVGLSIFTGCSGGSDGLFDEVATKYNAVASPRDGVTVTDDIDVVRNLDCDGDPATDDPEPFWDFSAEVTIDNDATGSEFRVESYTVNFRPNHGSCFAVSYNAGDMTDLTSTALNPINHNYGSPVIPPDSSLTVYLAVWSHGDKDVYDAQIDALIGAGAYLDADFTYDMQIVLYCRFADDETFQITTPWTPVHFTNIDNCDA